MIDSKTDELSGEQIAFPEFHKLYHDDLKTSFKLETATRGMRSAVSYSVGIWHSCRNGIIEPTTHRDHCDATNAVLENGCL